MKQIEVNIVNRGNNPLPHYATTSSAGMDVRAYLEAPVTIEPGARALIPTGLYVSIPDGYEIQMRPRSGLALKHGVTLVNTPGTIDADYRGEIGVILINHGDKPFAVNPGERICQMVLAPCIQASWRAVDELDSTERGDGGFGHTGTK